MGRHHVAKHEADDHRREDRRERREERRREREPRPPEPPDPEPPTPDPPPTDTWPRVGASYYTSLTDVRVDVQDWAHRLRDAGCDYTRVWLLDAWAIPGGTGCYDGLVPWERTPDGRFDLWALNPRYLARVRAYVEAMNAAGVLPELSGLELYTWSDRKQGMLWVPPASRWCLRYNRQGVYYGDDSAFDRIGQMVNPDAFLAHFHKQVVSTLTGLVYTVEIANEMPEKPMHARLKDAWRAGGYTGTFAVNRNDDTPGQYANMKIGQDYDRLNLHGKRDLDYLEDVYSEEPTYQTFAAFYASGSYQAARVTLSSDGCRKSTDVNDAYDYDALGEVFMDALARGSSIEHQSRIKLRGFTEGRIDLNDLEADWLRSLKG